MDSVVNAYNMTARLLKMLAVILPTVQATLNFLWYASTMSVAQLWSRVWYFPGIVHNSVVVALSFGKYRWFDRIDDSVILGALPFRSQTKELVDGEGVRGVISITEPFELKFFTNSSQDWFRAGVQHLHLTSVDRHPPLQADIDRGVTMIEAHSARKESIYVHCKAGKGRSATLVACYLVKVHKVSPQQAVELLVSKRPQVKLNKHHRASLNLYYQRLQRSQ